MIAKTFKFLILMLLIAIPLLIACKPEEEINTSLSAGLSELEGRVEIKQAEEGEFSPAEDGSMLHLNGQLQTGDEGKVRLDLSTGTILRVSPSSLFTLVANEEVEGGLATKIQLELGRIFIILNGGSTEVETPSGVASVRGSHQMVEFDPVTGNVTVTCLTGMCTAKNQAGEVNFTEGEKVILFKYDPETGQFLAPTVEPMDEDDYKLWLENNPDLADIINQALEQLNNQGGLPPNNPPPSDPPPTDPPPGGSSSGSGSGDSECMSLNEPADGTEWFTFGEKTFSWSAPQGGAAYYEVNFKFPNGYVLPIETTETSMKRFIESMPDPGDYEWSVSAFDEDGNLICSSETFIFEKDDTEKWLKEQNERRKQDDDDDDSCTGEECYYYQYYEY